MRRGASVLSPKSATLSRVVVGRVGQDGILRADWQSEHGGFTTRRRLTTCPTVTCSTNFGDRRLGGCWICLRFGRGDGKLLLTFVSGGRPQEFESPRLGTWGFTQRGWGRAGARRRGCY